MIPNNILHEQLVSGKGGILSSQQILLYHLMTESILHSSLSRQSKKHPLARLVYSSEIGVMGCMPRLDFLACPKFVR